jgi:hypothetical protein
MSSFVIKLKEKIVIHKQLKSPSKKKYGTGQIFAIDDKESELHSKRRYKLITFGKTVLQLSFVFT